MEIKISASVYYLSSAPLRVFFCQVFYLVVIGPVDMWITALDTMTGLCSSNVRISFLLCHCFFTLPKKSLCDAFSMPNTPISLHNITYQSYFLSLFVLLIKL